MAAFRLIAFVLVGAFIVVIGYQLFWYVELVMERWVQKRRELRRKQGLELVTVLTEEELAVRRDQQIAARVAWGILGCVIVSLSAICLWLLGG